jgi:16S rRNA (guanine(1405)-N(7))-methyltransferase
MKRNYSVDPSELANTILSSRKYRDLNLPSVTVIDLISRGLDSGMKPSQAVDDARNRLHNIIAPYLGDPDYEAASFQLNGFAQPPDPTWVKEFCLTLLQSHASTRERIPHMETFYREIFKVTGTPRSVLDLACALQPFAHPWMTLPTETEYLAFDLHQPRVDLINQFFSITGIRGKAIFGDILLDIPIQFADTAFFFKEAHRFEQRQKGCNRSFWQALNVNWLIVSLPATNLSGRFDLADRQRKLVSDTLIDLDWPVTEIQCGNELVFCIHKGQS